MAPRGHRLGIALSVGVPRDWRIGLIWVYGVAGLVGFLAQIVVGMQGRLVPLYAWYRAYDARGGVRPERAANALPSESFARIVFLAWALGVPALAWGLAGENRPGHRGLCGAPPWRRLYRRSIGGARDPRRRSGIRTRHSPTPHGSGVPAKRSWRNRFDERYLRGRVYRCQCPRAGSSTTYR